MLHPSVFSIHSLCYSLLVLQSQARQLPSPASLSFHQCFQQALCTGESSPRPHAFLQWGYISLSSTACLELLAAVSHVALILALSMASIKGATSCEKLTYWNYPPSWWKGCLESCQVPEWSWIPLLSGILCPGYHHPGLLLGCHTWLSRNSMAELAGHTLPV